jgi:hypothetical protein
MPPTMEWGELPESDRHAMPILNPFMMTPMSIFGVARTASLVSGVLAFAAKVAAQAAPSDPARFVASIYADGRQGVVWAEWLDGGSAGNGFRSADGAMGAVRCPRSQDGRRTRRSRFRRRDEFARARGQEIYGLRRSRETPRMRALSRGSRPTIGCVNRSGRTRFITTSSGSADAGRSTTSIP